MAPALQTNSIRDGVFRPRLSTLSLLPSLAMHSPQRAASLRVSRDWRLPGWGRTTWKAASRSPVLSRGGVCLSKTFPFTHRSEQPGPDLGTLQVLITFPNISGCTYPAQPDSQGRKVKEPSKHLLAECLPALLCDALPLSALSPRRRDAARLPARPVRLFLSSQACLAARQRGNLFLLYINRTPIFHSLPKFQSILFVPNSRSLHQTDIPGQLRGP